MTGHFDRPDSRRRINLSFDPATYEQLQKAARVYGFRNACEILTALMRIVVDRARPAEQRIYDLPDADGDEIDEMIAEVGRRRR